jgi:uncharacterized SAM-binding protein YcdF (DUF218 family)
MMAVLSVLVVFVTLGMAWLAACYTLFYSPRTEPLHEVDAVVVLAGASGERLPAGLELMEQDIAPVLVLSSTGSPGNVHSDRLCDHRLDAPYRLICFAPEVHTTRGEARSIARLAKDNGWDRVAVVTSRYHVARASIYLAQCTTKEVTMVATDPDASPAEWLQRFAEESTASLSALFRPVCSQQI